MRDVLRLLAGLALAAGGASAAAATVLIDASGFVDFNALDSDSNDYVSRVEARSVAGVERSFDTADINGDGLLDRAEYERARAGGEVQRRQ